MADPEILGPETPHDPLTGEILSPTPAADGALVPHAATRFGDFLNMLEGGQFAVDLRQDTGEMLRRMTELAEATGNKQKGAVAIKIDYSTEGDVITVVGAYKLTPPKENRRRTPMWLDDQNRVVPTPPKQGQFFGVRAVDGPSKTIRRI
jgi:hypothetical protein